MWTTVRPGKPGWYWYKAHDFIGIVEVCLNPRSPLLFARWIQFATRRFRVRSSLLKTMDGQWSERLQLPPTENSIRESLSGGSQLTHTVIVQ